MSERERMKQFATIIQMWSSKYNTAEIAKHTGVDEHIVARWIWSYREISRAA